MRLFISEQDIDFLHSLARGKTYKQIAENLGITISGLKQRIRPLLNVFGAETVPHLIAICMASGVIDTPELSRDFDIYVREYQRRGGNSTRQTYSLRAVRDEPV